MASWSGDGNTTDSVAGRDGTLENGAGFGSGKVGQAFLLDGSNDFISVPDDSVWTLSGDFTLALWANFAAIRSGGAGSLPNVLIGHDQGGGSVPKWVFHFVSPGQLTFHINGSGSAFLSPPSSFSPTLGEWHHLAVKRSGNTFTFYADGGSLGSVVAANTIVDASAPLTIGQSEGLGHLNGSLDEIKIYDEALSDAAIAVLAIPEPASMGLVVLGIGGLALRRRHS